MKTLQAKVVNGRFVIDAPSPYPDGTVLDLVVVEEPAGTEDESMGAEERAALTAAIERSKADFKAGRTHSLEDVIRGRKRIA